MFFKRFSKIDSDIHLAQSFSKEFLRIQDELRIELGIDNNICSEDLLNIEPRDIPDHQEHEIRELEREILGDDAQYVMDLTKKRETVSYLLLIQKRKKCK